MGRFRGVTLVEILLAMAILGVALLGVVSVFLGGLKLINKSNEVTVANALARELLEKTKMVGSSCLPSTLTVYDGSVPDPRASSGFPPPPYPLSNVDGRDYHLLVTAQPVSGVPNVVSVQVEVRWDSQSRIVQETYFKR